MAQIPVYQEKVSLNAGGTPTPRLESMPASASGVDVGEAVEGLGNTVEKSAAGIGAIVAHKQKLDAQEKVDNLSEQASEEWQNHLHGEGGLLTLQGDAAKGITAGDPFMGPKQGEDKGIKYKDTFDGFSSALKQKYLGQASTDFERRALNHSLDSHERVLRNAVIAHEGQQAKVAREQASEAAVSALKNTGVDASTVGDLQHVTDQGMDERERALRNEGHSDKAVIDAVRMKTADEFADASIHANLERDPEAAQALLDGVKPKLSNLMAATLQDRIDGKMVSIRSDAINKQIVEDPQSRNDDMTFNLGFVEKKAAELAAGRPVHEREHLVKMAKEQATMADAAMRQQKEQAQRSYLDGFAELRDKGLSFPEAEKTVMAKVGKQYGKIFGAAETDDLREKAVKIYKRDPEAIESRLSVMRFDQKQAYADAVNVIKSKYKKQTAVLPGETEKMSLADAMINQLKPLAPKMTPAQIAEWTKKGLENVVVKPGWVSLLDDRKPAWQVNRNKQ